ncbi:MAG TPA: hypothetical protein PLO61_02930 [Fimbriimonadaceae bacterium]|nr:hypothetical protein [Fimbriimonadaceae bacterium]HRJ32063.1 hypothetical protein [Fimbriimonadaceae bacterium]
MTCPDCPRYDPDRATCKDGKVNPRTWGQAVDVANHLGVRSICLFNDHRERLVRSRLSPMNLPTRKPPANIE